MNRDIHISIVSHNQLSLVNNVLNDLELLDSKNRFQLSLTLNVPEAELIDLSHFSFPIKVISNILPKGFGDNHNQAFNNMPDIDYFIIINPDVCIKQDVFSDLVDKLSLYNTIGVIAPLVRNYQGEIEDSCRELPTPLRIVKKIFGDRGMTKYFNEYTTFEPDWIAGMFMAFRSEVFNSIKGFNIDYFLYYEDVELCSRLWLDDFLVVINPAVSIIHSGQRESHRKINYLQWHLKSMLRFFLSNTYRRVKKFHSNRNLKSMLGG